MGLSLSYDIVKAHGGEIKVEDEREGEGTEFIIQITNCLNELHEIINKNILAFILAVFVTAQSRQNKLDSMQVALQHAANDTIRMDVYNSFGYFYDDVNLDSSVYYSEKGVAIAQQLQLKLNEAEMLMSMSFPLTKMGNYPRSLKVLMQASDIAEDPSSEKNTLHLIKGQTPQTYRLSMLGYIHLGLGYLYDNTGNYEKANCHLS